MCACITYVAAQPWVQGMLRPLAEPQAQSMLEETPAPPSASGTTPKKILTCGHAPTGFSEAKAKETPTSQRESTKRRL